MFVPGVVPDEDHLQDGDYLMQYLDYKVYERLKWDIRPLWAPRSMSWTTSIGGAGIPPWI